MIRSRLTKIFQTSALVMAATLFTLASQTAPTSPSSTGERSALPVPTKEVTVIGRVERLESHPASGGPGGFHLFISASDKTVDAHLGPFLSKQNREALQPGQLVQIVGRNQNIHGRDVLLARELTVGGRLVNLRNGRGVIVRERPARRSAGERKTGLNGAAQ